MQTSKKPMIFIIALLMGILPYGVVSSYERLDGQAIVESKSTCKTCPDMKDSVKPQPATIPKPRKQTSRASVPEETYDSQPKTKANSEFARSIDIPMVAIPAGSFSMGSHDGDLSEKPVHTVNIKAFEMSATEVTQGQWQAVMGSNPSYFKDCGTNCPVENVSWDDVQTYIRKLNVKTGQTYRLPSEAEWEYAARAGTSTPFHTGDNLTTEQANYNGNNPYNNYPKGQYREKTIPVGSFAPNALGLYDMSGNVWEWVQDRWHSNYTGAPTDGSAWENVDNTGRVLRGGSWFNLALVARSGYRSHYWPAIRINSIGFRLARTC